MQKASQRNEESTKALKAEAAFKIQIEDLRKENA